MCWSSMTSRLDHERICPIGPSLDVVEGSVLDVDVVQEVLMGATSSSMPLRAISSCRPRIRETTSRSTSAVRSTSCSRRGTSAEPYRLYVVLLDLRQSSVPPDRRRRTMNLLSPYAVSKSAGEGYCHAFYESYDLPTAVVRYSNVYGPEQSAGEPVLRRRSKLFQAALAGEPLQIHGDGEQTRDYTFVEDAVAATLSAAVSPKATGQAYNVGTGVETSVNRLRSLILEITGASSEPG